MERDSPIDRHSSNTNDPIDHIDLDLDRHERFLRLRVVDDSENSSDSDNEAADIPPPVERSSSNNNVPIPVDIDVNEPGTSSTSSTIPVCPVQLISGNDNVSFVPSYSSTGHNDVTPTLPVAVPSLIHHNDLIRNFYDVTHLGSNKSRLLFRQQTVKKNCMCFDTDLEESSITRRTHCNKRRGGGGDTVNVEDESDTSIDSTHTMVWSIKEAISNNIDQSEPSSCGLIAVQLLLRALEYRIAVNLREFVSFRSRGNRLPVPGYLISRSLAGTTADDLVQAVATATGGRVYGRFFHMFPKRDVNLFEWLSSWIQRGCVPIATLNPQVATSPMADAWHHQLIHGVGPSRAFLTNPLETQSWAVLERQLCSDSVLLVKRDDVVSRWTDSMDLTELVTDKQLDDRWLSLNVIGQVVHVLREFLKPVASTDPYIHLLPERELVTHVTIPTNNRSGITLFCCNSTAANQLKAAPELGVLH